MGDMEERCVLIALRALLSMHDDLSQMTFVFHSRSLYVIHNVSVAAPNISKKMKFSLRVDQAKAL